MPLPLAAAAPLISVGSRFLGGLFGGNAKKKQEEAQRKAAIGQAELRNEMGEDTRTANASTAASLLGQAGSDFALDPGVTANLAKRRTYDFAKGAPAAGAGIGSSLLSGLFGTVGDVASQYGINDGASPGQAGVPMQEAPEVADLRSRVGEFDTGIDYELDPTFRG